MLRLGLFVFLLFFFMPVSFLHLECVPIGKLTAIPPGDRPSHPISQYAAGCVFEGAYATLADRYF